jgi:hypothetical protein
LTDIAHTYWSMSQAQEISAISLRPLVAGARTTCPLCVCSNGVAAVAGVQTSECSHEAADHGDLLGLLRPLEGIDEDSMPILIMKLDSVTPAHRLFAVIADAASG